MESSETDLSEFQDQDRKEEAGSGDGNNNDNDAETIPVSSLLQSTMKRKHEEIMLVQRTCSVKTWYW